jgi:type I restriction enzyme R subunit
MWMTGFDVPSCSTIYLDKPQRNHTLMQTIARANRVFGDKVNGLIVDYIGIFRDLERALAIYAEGTDPEGSNPIRNKSELVEQLRGEIAEVKEFCANLGVDLPKIEEAEPKTFERIQGIEDAVNSILINDETKGDYLQRASHIFKLYKAILPDGAANEFRGICSLINIIAQRLRTLIPSVDPSDVREEIENLLDQSIVPTDYITEASGDYETNQMVDLSQIDFDQLRERFKTRHKQIEVEKLRGAINRTLSQMVRLNKTRMDYQEKFEEMIAEYNDGSVDAALVWERLLALVEELNAEDQRTIAEQLSEEELTVFDLLTRPALLELELTEAERDEVKAVSKKLLTTLKQEKLVLDWRKRQQSRAAVRVAIDEILDELPECYEPNIYDQKCEAVYQHIYESYYGDGNSIYGVAA